MKKVLLLMLGIFAFLVTEVSAHVIIVSGGTKDHHYYYVYSSNRKTECRGVGNNPCVTQSGVVAGIKITYQEILDSVLNQYDKGVTRGQMNYNNVIPVSWKINQNDELEINIDDSKYVD